MMARREDERQAGFIFNLYSRIRSVGDVMFHDHGIEPLPALITSVEAVLISTLLERLTLPGERQIFALYPVGEEGLNPGATAQWDEMTRSDWTTLLQKHFYRRAWFPPIRMALRWVLGIAHTRDKSAEVIRFAWNRFENDTFLMIVTADPDTTRLEGVYVDDMEDYGTDEEIASLIRLYPVVLSRGHDGLGLNVCSTRVDSRQLLGLLRELPGVTDVKV